MLFVPSGIQGVDKTPKKILLNLADKKVKFDLRNTLLHFFMVTTQGIDGMIGSPSKTERRAPKISIPCLPKVEI
jgi:hypothetical protein